MVSSKVCLVAQYVATVFFSQQQPAFSIVSCVKQNTENTQKNLI